MDDFINVNIPDNIQYVTFSSPPKIHIDESRKYTLKYSQTTTEYYKALRVRKMDPIMLEEVDINTSYQYKYMWDPYTGEVTGLDPYGPICFNPNVLIKHYYTNRLTLLWSEPEENEQGYFEGYYDIGIGSGEDIYIQSRGFQPEKYLFRLPIIDCYLTNDHSNSIITMGPKLTDQDIEMIDQLAEKTSYYKLKYRMNRPKLSKIKYWYDQALSKTPDITNIDKEILVTKTLEELYEYANRMAVEELKKIKG